MNIENASEASAKKLIPSKSVRTEIKKLVPSASLAAYVISRASFGDGCKFIPSVKSRYRDYIIGGLPAADVALEKLKQTEFRRCFRKNGVVGDVSCSLLQAMRELHQTGDLSRLYQVPVEPLVFRFTAITLN